MPTSSSTHCEVTPASPVASVASYGELTTVNGVVGSFAKYSMAVHMYSQPPKTRSCAKCGYRQYVKGHFKSRILPGGSWTTLTHTLGPGPTLLSETAYGEDGCGYGSTDFYGHRYATAGKGCNQDWSGCSYRAHDRPFMNGVAGTEQQWSLDFKAQAIGYKTPNPSGMAWKSTPFTVLRTGFLSVGVSTYAC